MTFDDMLLHNDPVDLADELYNFAILKRAAGHTDEAVEVIKNTTKLRRGVLEMGDTSIKPDLCNALHNLAVYLSTGGQHTDALKAVEEEIALRGELAVVGSGMKKQLADALVSSAIYLRELGRNAQALIADEEALAIRRQRFAVDPRSPEGKSDVADSLLDLAIDLTEVDQNLKRDPATAHRNLGFHLRAFGRHTDARSIDNESVELLRQLASTASDPGIQTDLPDSLDCLAVDCKAAGDSGESLKAHEEEVRLRRAVNAALLSSSEQDSTKKPEALKSKGTSQVHYIKLRKELVDGDPTIKQDLAISLNNLAINFRAAGRHDEALDADEYAIRLRRELSETDSSMRLDLARSLASFGLNLSDIAANNSTEGAAKKIPAWDVFKELPIAWPILNGFA
ncbi:hypothetical protein FB451DRAFT_1407704 [Mycena latifolia]|nr:hypothetical protein FB451DRAFT_1407704 [Mycena latifolia]